MISVSPEPRSMPLVLLSFLTRMMADLSLFISIPVEMHQSSIIYRADFNFVLDVLVNARSSAYAMAVSVTFSSFLSSGDIYIENKLGEITAYEDVPPPRYMRHRDTILSRWLATAIEFAPPR